MHRRRPPGAAAVVHYRFAVPGTRSGTLEIEAALRYRKFDSRFYRTYRSMLLWGLRNPWRGVVVVALVRLSIMMSSWSVGPW